MRVAAIVFSASVSMMVSAGAFAQDWAEFVSVVDRFGVNFPDTPVIQDLVYDSAHGARMPARRYSSSHMASRFSVTVVDFRDAQRIHRELLANESEVEQRRGRNRWINDQRAAVARAASEFRQRGGEVTYDAWGHIDHVEGHQLQMTNSDGSRTFVGIYFHAKARLFYVLEAHVPRSAPPPGQFQQSLTFRDEEGLRIRYSFDPEGVTTRIPVATAE